MNWFVFFCVVAIALSGVGLVLSTPWEPWNRGDASFRVGVLQTFATWSALVVAVPAAWAAWRAYGMAVVRVPVRVTLGDTRGPEFNEPLRLSIESREEVGARDFVVQITFSVPLNGEEINPVWHRTDPRYLQIDDAPPNIYGVTFFLSGSFSSSEPEVLVDLELDQMRVLRPSARDFEIVLAWSVRGGNVIPDEGTLRWSASPRAN